MTSFCSFLSLPLGAIAQHCYHAMYFIFLIWSVSLSGFLLLVIKDLFVMISTEIITTRKEISLKILSLSPQKSYHEYFGD